MTQGTTMDQDDEPDRDDGPKDSTRLNWMQAQGYLTMAEQYLAEPGGKPFVELIDMSGDVVGSGLDLRAAIDDAMGVPR